MKLRALPSFLSCGLLILFLCASAPLLPAFDFGLILNQDADYGGYGNDGSFTYSGSLIPRLSALLGDTGSLYISAVMEAAYDDEWTFAPELLRTELSMYSGNLEFTAGRMYYSDPLGFIAQGLFDGAQIAYDTEAGTFSAGAWYTGFLYKRRANITMTAEDYERYAAALDFSDFKNTYFAPRRVVASLGWEHLGWPVKTRLSLLGQFDVSGGDELLHSQYLVGKITMPHNMFSFDLGGCLELIQDDGESGTAFAAEAGIAFMPAARLPMKLSLLGCYSSAGEQAFLPLTTVNKGEIFKPKLSGLSFVSLDYIARLNRELSAGVTSTYFIRSDLETYSGYPLADESDKGYFLGNEFFARLLWSPYSDLQINLGGGVFLPSMGNVEPKAEPYWQVKLNVVFSLY